MCDRERESVCVCVRILTKLKLNERIIAINNENKCAIYTKCNNRVN